MTHPLRLAVLAAILSMHALAGSLAAQSLAPRLHDAPTLRFDRPVPGVRRVSAASGYAGRPADDRRVEPAPLGVWRARAFALADPADSLALVALYEATSGANWADRTGWLAGPVAGWKGVSLDTSGRVTELVLSGNNLAGPLPAALTGLDSLRVLDLSANALTGPLPATIGELGALVNLRFWGNELSGSLPDGLADLAALEELWLFDNAFTGAIPPALGQLSALRILYLDQNALSGTVPESLGQLPALVELFLDTNALSGPVPEALGQLTTLEVLFLGDNDLEGPLPASFEQLTNLTNLSLRNLPLNGTFPGVVYAMQRLNALNLANTGVEGPLTESIYGMQVLTRLYLEDNKLSGEIPPDLGLFAINIREMNLRNNQFSGTIPASLGSLGLLELLDLSDNAFTGDIPAGLGLPQRMRYLYLDGNQLGGNIPEDFAAMQLLTQLDLADNRLSGPLPEWIGRFQLLNWLNLGLNQFDGFIPEGLGEAPSLQLVSLWQNRLEGPIPSTLGGLRSLLYLDFGSNRLSGDIPEAIGEPPALLQVFLDNNELTGRIPESLSRQASLEVLSLDGNQLSGAVPEGFNALSQMVRFTLAGNRIEELPVLTGMTGLDLLDVRANRLTFEDLQPNVPLAAGASFLYAPQQQVDPVVDRIEEGTRIAVAVGGDGNAYQWYRSATALAGATAPALLLDGDVNADVVQCAVTNPGVPGLTLVSAPVTADVMLTRIDVLPDSVVVSPGDSLVFAAAGFDQRDGALRFTPRWSAEGGTIDSTGFFVAGEAFGIFDVRVENLAGDVAGTARVVIVDPGATGIRDPGDRPRGAPALSAYPNPFAREATIAFDLAETAVARLALYDVLGREVATIWNGPLAPGRHAFPVDGSALPAGLYLYRLDAGGPTEAGMLVKGRP
ncbi:MAG: hypothetical protein R2834_20170 [Rhodothermales bacterium]